MLPQQAKQDQNYMNELQKAVTKPRKPVSLDANGNIITTESKAVENTKKTEPPPTREDLNALVRKRVLALGEQLSDGTNYDSQQSVLPPLNLRVDKAKTTIAQTQIEQKTKLLENKELKERQELKDLKSLNALYEQGVARVMQEVKGMIAQVERITTTVLK